MEVIGFVVDLLALPVGPHQARALQQPQVMADQRHRQAKPLGDIRHRERRAQAGDHDLQPRGIAQQPEQVG